MNCCKWCMGVIENEYKGHRKREFCCNACKMIWYRLQRKWAGHTKSPKYEKLEAELRRKEALLDAALEILAKEGLLS